MTGETGCLCVITPVRHEEEDPLRTELRALPAGRHSPFARIETTHFARLTIVPNLEPRSGEPACKYLLFASEFDGTAEDYLAAMSTRMAFEAHAIWRHCLGYESIEESLADYLIAHRLEPGFSFATYPGVTVGQVRESLHLRDRLSGFSVHAAELDPAALQAAWLDAFPLNGA